MRENKLFVELHQIEEDFSITSQYIESNEEPDVKYYVADLNDCPEDATIERNLFSAEQYIAAVNLGIKLAQKGYTKVEVEYVKDVK